VNQSTSRCLLIFAKKTCQGRKFLLLHTSLNVGSKNAEKCWFPSIQSDTVHLYLPIRGDQLKRLVLTVPDEIAVLMKRYADYKNNTISNVCIELIKANIHKQAYVCKVIDGILEDLNIPIDKRAHKNCYGYACASCKHIDKCRVGLFDGSYEVTEDCAKNLKPGAVI